ncbi:hypothetical protein Holit_00828 [Hollandina sp. SP2]
MPQSWGTGEIGLLSGPPLCGYYRIVLFLSVRNNLFSKHVCTTLWLCRLRNGGILSGIR